ncbi:protein MpHD10 [Marchantia polymorpha subsp. ruderalis]|uniref:Homeobox domain-containing protein n=2 Tax=Marchantia polymorpha TaxID=3197 RepID=A0AAF6BHV2_MARPO|nr:hypothetical protein MARPO_0032s0010 [Marchantia polymorpha]BBN11584.1 hypothetical protein Mp_5g13160 [Marchantia polymorpha subsp. ruderalis]PTQ41800.1 hypothetical protein MARPO_0032s0010 [Marchantia polymorpha]PTQ41801.1 hypothetical protein MARPO_0032s0010 [Marchantia polymorpha]BBN11585.1 hypothetical protein Mp_5g13160 [Marchantia polymorpha subsp. ruderalis]|eukprot:PTQ41799.1 hypothetical protein MARPO_0032s0010 [Marchantia polymorpha]
MEPEADVHEGAGESSSFGSVLELGGEPRTECTYSVPNEINEGLAEMPEQNYGSSLDMTPDIGRESYALRPGIEFSTDLRMELSADVLASLGGSSNDVEKPPEDNLLDISSMREDLRTELQFIQELSMSPPPDPVNSSDPGNFTSEGANTHTEADSGAYGPVDSVSAEVQYDCAVPASTDSDSPVHAQVDPTLGETVNDQVHPSVFETSAQTPVEATSNMVSFAASLSFPMTSMNARTLEVVGSTYYENCPVASGPDMLPSDRVVYHPVDVASNSQSTNTTVTPLSVLDATGGGNETSSPFEVEGTASAIALVTSDVNSCGDKDTKTTELEESAVTYVPSSEEEACFFSVAVGTDSLQVPSERISPPAAERAQGLSPSSSPVDFSKNIHERPAVSGDDDVGQDVPVFPSTLTMGESCSLDSGHLRDENSAVKLPELAALGSYGTGRFSGVADHEVASSTAEGSAVIHVEKFQTESHSSFAQDLPEAQADLSNTCSADVLVVSAVQALPLFSRVEASEGNKQIGFLHLPTQAPPLSSPSLVSEMELHSSVNGQSSPPRDSSAPSGNVSPVAYAPPYSPEPPVIQATPGSADAIISKSEAPARLEPSLLSPKAPRADSETSLLSARPGHFWDVPSSSGRSLPALPTLSAYFDGSRSPFRGRKTARRKKSSESVFDSKGKTSGEMDRMDEVVELENMIEAQKKTMQWQIDELQRIMMKQCELTGKNPLSEEMIYEVLGEKGADKKLGEVPSAEALKSMKEVFAIKDTITKKEAREISSMTGATVTQVREFFQTQRNLVKKLVQQVYDETGRVGIKNASEQSQPSIPTISNNVGVERDLGFHKLTSIESVERSLELMRAERTFFGQMQLLQIILQTEAGALILRRFLEKGGLKVVGGWLVEAAAEEQTSVLRQLLKVLGHLPISQSVPHQMPALVQNVNKLRFYQNSDISSQARALLAMWSKMLKQKTEAPKPAAAVTGKPTAALERNLASAPGVQKRNRETLSVTHGGSGPRKKKAKEEETSQTDLKASGVPSMGSPSRNISGLVVVDPTVSNQPSVPNPPPAAKQRWSHTLQPSESAVAAVSVSRKRVVSKSLGDHAKERRKLQLVEDKPAGKSFLTGGASKSSISKNSRPLSTDDIYKAKKLQRLMQEPLTKSRRKAAAAEETSQTVDVDLKTVPKKSVPPSRPEQQDLSRGSTGNTSVSDYQFLNKRVSSTAGIIERTEVSKWETLASRLQQDMYQPSITPTSSPDRGQRTITPTASPDRPQLIITPIASPERPPIEKPNSPPDLSEIVSTPLSPEDIPQRVITSTSDRSQGILSSAAILDSIPQKTYPKSTSVSADESQIFTPFSSNPGLMESVHHAMIPQQVQQPTDTLVPGFPFACKEPSDATVFPVGGEVVRPTENMPRDNPVSVTVTNTHPAFLDQNHPSAPVSGQLYPQMESGRPATGVPLYTIPSPTPENEVEVKEGQQFVESSSSRFPPKEPAVIDFYAALRANMIRWRIPAEFHLDPQWNVAAGEDSKEKEMQSARVKREEEAYYPDASTIPSDPKDPWEEEPNYDDSLTFEIFLDNNHRKAASAMQISTDHMSAPTTNVMPSGIAPNSFMAEPSNNMFQPGSGYSAADSSVDQSRRVPNVSGLDLLLQQLSAGGGVAHDPALLTLLLQNPDLVNQLTAGQGYPQSGNTTQNVFAPPLDSLKQSSNSGNLGVGLRTSAGDLGLDRVGASNISVTMPPDTMRVEDSALKHSYSGMGHQQNPGFVTQVGVDNRYSAPPQMQPAVGSNSGWEQGRMPPLPPLPPPPPLPPMPSGGNQVLQSSVQPQANKVTNWPEPQQAWNSVGTVVGRPAVNTAQIHSGQELHMRPQNIMTHNVRPPNYGGMVPIPQVEVSSVVSQQEMHNASQRQWTNAAHLVIAPSANDNSMIQAGQESGAGRNNRWPRPPGPPPPPPPPDPQMRPVGREYSDFQGNRQANVAENMTVWVPNERGRPGPPPFQGSYRPPPPPPPPPYPAPQQQHWQQTPERNVRPVQTSAVPPYPPHGRDLRTQQQPPQPWHPNMGPPPRPMWRGPQ